MLLSSLGVPLLEHIIHDGGACPEAAVHHCISDQLSHLPSTVVILLFMPLGPFLGTTLEEGVPGEGCPHLPPPGCLATVSCLQMLGVTSFLCMSEESCCLRSWTLCASCTLRICLTMLQQKSFMNSLAYSTPGDLKLTGTTESFRSSHYLSQVP
jgi:hypothetical protein